MRLLPHTSVRLPSRRAWAVPAGLLLLVAGAGFLPGCSPEGSGTVSLTPQARGPIEGAGGTAPAAAPAEEGAGRTGRFQPVEAPRKKGRR